MNNSPLTISGVALKEILIRSQVGAQKIAEEMTISDWTRIHSALSDAIKRLPSAWRVVFKSLDGVHCKSRSGMQAILSGSKELDGRLWMHLSISRERLVPNWEQLVDCKNIFLGKDVIAVQVFPREADYVNIHRFVLHLWQCLDADPVPDFTHGTGSI